MKVYWDSKLNYVHFVDFLPPFLLCVFSLFASLPLPSPSLSHLSALSMSVAGFRCVDGYVCHFQRCGCPFGRIFVFGSLCISSTLIRTNLPLSLSYLLSFWFLSVPLPFSFLSLSFLLCLFRLGSKTQPSHVDASLSLSPS